MKKYFSAINFNLQGEELPYNWQDICEGLDEVAEDELEDIDTSDNDAVNNVLEDIWGRYWQGEFHMPDRQFWCVRAEGCLDFDFTATTVGECVSYLKEEELWDSEWEICLLDVDFDGSWTYCREVLTREDF